MSGDTSTLASLPPEIQPRRRALLNVCNQQPGVDWRLPVALHMYKNSEDALMSLRISLPSRATERKPLHGFSRAEVQRPTWKYL